MNTKQALSILIEITESYKAFVEDCGLEFGYEEREALRLAEQLIKNLESLEKADAS